MDVCMFCCREDIFMVYRMRTSSWRPHILAFACFVTICFILYNIVSHWSIYVTYSYSSWLTANDAEWARIAVSDVNISALDTPATGGNNSSLLVPNIVHLIWFGASRQFTFINYVSVLSVIRFQKPAKILLHCDHLPIGRWWQRLKHEGHYDNEAGLISIMARQPPAFVGRSRIDSVYHQADVVKLEVLVKYGGIYVDLDVILLRSLNPLRVYEASIGREKPPKLIMGVMLARKGARFLRLWLDSYKHSYKPDLWDYNSGIVPYHLYTLRPDLLHVESRALTTPDWTERHLLWNDVIDWRPLYVVHIMTHKIDTDFKPDNIKTLNNTFGAVMRYVYYGSSDVL